MTHWHEWIQSPLFFELILFLISVVAGIFGAILGLGGGVLIVPALALLFGVQIRYAVGASIVSVIATSSGAAATYVRDHITNIRVAMVLEVATTVGALCGAILSPYFPARALFAVFSLILFYSAFSMLRKRGDHSIRETNDPWAARLSLNSSYPDPKTGKPIPYSVDRVPLGFSLMLGAGVISGLLGIGSGALKVPAMDTALRLPIKVSSATSNFMIGVTAAASAGAYYMRGDILPLLAAPVALGVLGGSMIGTKVMMRIHNDRMRQLFIVVLVAIALEMGLKSYGFEVR
ncbi:MAG: sulfite exporter TauE/SafE family protein [Bdellovibrionota bacterium]